MKHIRVMAYNLWLCNERPNCDVYIMAPPRPNKSRTSEVTVAVGTVKSARDEEQRSEAKSQSESKTFSWIKQANHCQLWLGSHMTPSQGWEPAV